MGKILALDLGIASIGWAITAGELRNEDDIYDYGVRIFRPGMRKGDEGYSSRSAERREKRGARRLYERRLRRKLGLLRVLLRHKMCLLPLEQLRAWEAKARGKKAPFPDDAAFIAWLRLCPYELRARAVHEKLTAEELGRVFYHIAQRRGFKSNRKDDSDKKGKDIELTEQHRVELEAAGVKTLGELLYQKKQKGELLRFRHRGEDQSVKSSRLTYQDEFEVIAETQGLDEVLRKELHKALFFQRPLKSQKHSVGRCVLEREKTRCPISAIEAEEFGLYQILNNIKVYSSDGEKRPLDDSEKQAILPLFYRKLRSFPAKDIEKALQKLHKKDKGLRINYRQDQPLTTYPTMALFYRIWGENWAVELDKAYSANCEKPKTLEESVQDVWHALYSFDDQDNLESWASRKLGLSGELLEEFGKANLKEGYSKLSRYALQKIVVHLKKRAALSYGCSSGKSGFCLLSGWSRGIVAGAAGANCARLFGAARANPKGSQ